MHFSLELPKIPLPTFLVLSFVLCTALFEYIRIILSAIAFDYIKQVSSCSVSIIPPLLCSIRSTATPSSLSVTGENLARHSRSNQNTSGKLTFSTERILLRRHRSCEKSDLWTKCMRLSISTRGTQQNQYIYPYPSWGRAYEKAVFPALHISLNIHIKTLHSFRYLSCCGYSAVGRRDPFRFLLYSRVTEVDIVTRILVDWRSFRDPWVVRSSKIDVNPRRGILSLLHCSVMKL